LSVSLRDLETQLGCPLFDRVKNRLSLNACGVQLRPVADDLLQRLAAAERLFKDQAEGGRLRLGASVTIGEHLLPPLLAGYLGQGRMQRPEITLANTASLCRMVEGFDIDAALVEGGTHGALLEVTPLWSDRLRVIAPPGHNLADGCKHAVADLSGQTWVLREGESGTREQFAVWLEPRLQSWHLGLEFGGNQAIVNAVAAGIGLGFLSEHAVADALALGRVKEIQLHEDCSRSLDLLTAPGKFQSPLLRRFIDYCRCWRPHNQEN
jgi:DNA-binding transcriptional LysR family regulator